MSEPLQRLDRMMDRLEQMPNSWGCVAEFSSANTALETLKRLSFVEVHPRSLAFPTNILCELLKTSTGATVIIGGSWSEEQYVEIFDLFKKYGRIERIWLPPGAS